MSKLIEWALNFIGVIGLVSFLISLPWWLISLMFFKPNYYVGVIGCIGGLVFFIVLNILIKWGK